LANILRDELTKDPKFSLYGPKNSEDRTSIVPFSIKGQEPETIVNKLEKLGIVLAVREIYEKKSSAPLLISLIPNLKFSELLML